MMLQCVHDTVLQCVHDLHAFRLSQKSVLQRVAVRCSALQRVEARCSALQRVAVRYTVRHKAQNVTVRHKVQNVTPNPDRTCELVMSHIFIIQ